jgi:hypothetical protein
MQKPAHALLVPADDWFISDEHHRHHESACAIEKLVKRPRIFPDVPFHERYAVLCEKISHLAALLSGGSWRFGVERVQRDFGHDTFGPPHWMSQPPSTKTIAPVM